MPAKYCYPTGRRVAPIECGTFDHCQPDCELRPHIKGSQPGPDHKCGMCKKPYPEVQFDPHRKTGKPKKTCTVCEAKYIKKTTPAAAIKPYIEKKTPAPSSAASPKPNILSGFTKLINPGKDSGIPSVKIGANALAFNPSARQAFQDLFEQSLSVDIHYKRNNGSVALAFELHQGENEGQYKLSRGSKGREMKISVRLYTKGWVKKGQEFEVREEGGILWANK